MTFKSSLYHALLRGNYEPEVQAHSVPDYEYNPLWKTGELTVPIIDLKWIEDGGQRPSWPGGKEFAVCLTHDTDELSYRNLHQNLHSLATMFRNLAKLPAAFLLRKIPARIYHSLSGLVAGVDDLSQFEKWLDLEDSIGARSTWFFAPGKVARVHITDCLYTLDQKVPFRGHSVEVQEVMRAMDQDGWEIGLHPSWNSHADLEEMINQKRVVETCLRAPITSVRQHYLKYDPSVTPGVHQASGFLYDSTLGYNNHIGFRRGTSYPFPVSDPKTGSRLNLLEIPLSLQDGAMVSPFKGMQLNIEQALDHIKSMTNHVRKTGGVLNLLWHPNRVGEQAFWDLYKQTLDYLKGFDPWFTTVNEIGKHWKTQDIDLNIYTRYLSNT